MIPKCTKHKKFKKDCPACLNYDLQKPKIRFPIKQTKVINKNIYSRKKHKGKNLNGKSDNGEDS